VRIIYADYYTPAIQFVLHAEKWGKSVRFSSASVCFPCSSSCLRRPAALA
jgi:hypothetical protein